MQKEPVVYLCWNDTILQPYKGHDIIENCYIKYKKYSTVYGHKTGVTEFVVILINDII